MRNGFYKTLLILAASSISLLQPDHSKAQPPSGSLKRRTVPPNGARILVSRHRPPHPYPLAHALLHGRPLRSIALTPRQRIISGTQIPIVQAALPTPPRGPGSPPWLRTVRPPRGLSFKPLCGAKWARLASS